jgi:hypothetical protein
MALHYTFFPTYLSIEWCIILINKYCIVIRVAYDVLGRPANSSSVHMDQGPENAVDGSPTSLFHSFHYTMEHSWWMVELDTVHLICGITVQNWQLTYSDGMI